MGNLTDPRTQTNASESSWTQFTQFPEYQLAMVIWKLCPPCIILLGAFGNIATVFVMSRIKDHNSSQHVFLIALAVCDFCILCAGTLREWLMFTFGLNVYRMPLVPCKLHALLVYSNRTLSAWLLTGVTVQRAMAVHWPHKMRVLCTVRRTWMVVAAVSFTACALHADKLVGMEMTSRGECAYVLEGYALFEHIWHWVDVCVSSLFPTVCLLVSDVILSWTLFKASSSTVVTGQAISNAADTNKDRRRTASRTTVMILVLSCTFLVLTLPLCILILWYDLVQMVPFSRTFARFQLGRAMTMNLWYTNSAINFLLYCFTGTKFRREFLRGIFCSA